MISKASTLNLLSYALLCATLILSVHSVAEPIAATIRIHPEEVFVPTGFDDNDNIQLVISGNYASNCYNDGPTQVSVDRAAKKVRIAYEARYIQKICLEMQMPYSSVVSLYTTLDAGEYSVESVTEDSVKQLGTFTVKPSKSKNGEPTKQDDFLYAPVDAVIVNFSGSVQKLKIQLAGTFHNSCLSIKEVNVIQNSPKVIEILPIMQKKANVVCVAKTIPFVHQLEAYVQVTGRVLVHVRTMNGQSENKVVIIPTAADRAKVIHQR